MSGQAFDVQYTQDATPKWRLVYAPSSEEAALVVFRSTWCKVEITDIKPITDRIRPSGGDWSAVP
jgi:hypothetical protein